ncbi:DUF4230 domain-containing protein [Robertkochia aurantiaca]|uniref:DUF4230 domain-containing protein n=1 Tax=Robertkochia aurantiaca TaxID=2873700 RepID=UPI001CC96EF0|nr:DUF4230 domain-containing protein [Robertkochia sp. 3YJGBD-33]
MRNFLLGVLITVLGFMLLWQSGLFTNGGADKAEVMILEEQIKNTAKLVVTESTFSEVFNYNETEKLFGSWLTTQKKALVLVKAEVSISYDLRNLNVQLDPENRQVLIYDLPMPELKIASQLEFYDVQGDYLNPFNAEDYNQVRRKVNNRIRQQAENSGLMANAENRIISELSGLFLLTRSMGWELVYEKEVLRSADDLEKVLPGQSVFN